MTEIEIIRSIFTRIGVTFTEEELEGEHFIEVETSSATVDIGYDHETGKVTEFEASASFWSE